MRNGNWNGNFVFDFDLFKISPDHLLFIAKDNTIVIKLIDLHMGTILNQSEGEESLYKKFGLGSLLIDNFDQNLRDNPSRIGLITLLDFDVPSEKHEVACSDKIIRPCQTKSLKRTPLVKAGAVFKTNSLSFRTFDTADKPSFFVQSTNQGYQALRFSGDILKVGALICIALTIISLKGLVYLYYQHIKPRLLVRPSGAI